MRNHVLPYQPRFHQSHPWKEGLRTRTCETTSLGTTHDTTLARVQGGLESKVERHAPPLSWGSGAFARAMQRGGAVHPSVVSVGNALLLRSKAVASIDARSMFPPSAKRRSASTSLVVCLGNDRRRYWRTGNLVPPSEIRRVRGPCRGPQCHVVCTHLPASAIISRDVRV